MSEQTSSPNPLPIPHEPPVLPPGNFYLSFHFFLILKLVSDRKFTSPHTIGNQNLVNVGVQDVAVPDVAAFYNDLT